jgi:phosphomannomutase
MNHPNQKSNTDLMFSISGIRGKIPTGLDIQSIISYTESFIETIQPKQIVIGRDSRPSGLFMENLIIGTLLSKGIKVINLGIVPTPTVKAVVKTTSSSGGIIITASHNPIEWNALKLIGKNGFFFSAEQMSKVAEFHQSQNFKPINHNPKSSLVSNSSEFIQTHIDSVLKRVDLNAIRKKKFKVFLDAVNGGGSIVIPELLKQLGCKVQSIYVDPTKPFPREPEPTPHSLAKSAKLMQKTDCEIGFALDPDADRLVLLSPTKGTVSEEYTLPISALSILPNKGKTYVTNLSSSFINEKILEKFSKTVIRSKVGEANVVKDMIDNNSFFGGEGNGGVIDPLIPSFGRDSLAGIAHILNYLSLTKVSIDALLDELPQIFMDKSTLPIQGKDLKSIYSTISDKFSNGKLDSKDGLRVNLGDSWFHIRPSNTEPILRIIAEANSKKDLTDLQKKVQTIISEI